MRNDGTSELERHDIQGMLLSAYGHLPWSANVLLQIDDPVLARAWLAALYATVTPATGKHHKLSLNVALAYPGLVKLGLDAPAAFPIAFVDGMATERRANILGDTGTSAPASWEWGTGPATVDVLLMLFTHARDALAQTLEEHRAAFAGAGLHEIATLCSQRHPDGKEHFGFSDGISQPAIRNEHRSEPGRRRTNATNDVAAGEFILGCLNEYNLPSDRPLIDAAYDPKRVLAADTDGKRDFGRNGSYLVLRQLEQDVAKFWRFVAAAAPNVDDGAKSPQWLAAKFVGRWPSGAPLVKTPHRDDERYANENDFGFAADPDGLSCPIGAHIRRANPRDGFANDRPQQSVRRSNRHRLLRRGRSYGPRIEDRFVDDGKSRGLHFIALNSDLERQFEFVHQTWLNNITFCGLANEVDPLVGAQAPGGLMTIQSVPVRSRVKGFERFVTTKGGAYFFLPSLRALRYLASLEPAVLA